MAQQIINIGSAPNDGTGDPIRTAMTKTNNNFSEFYSVFSPNTSTNNVTVANNLTVSSNLTVNSITVGNNVFVTGRVNSASFTVGSTITSNTLGLYVTTNTFVLGSNTRAANGFTFLPNGFRLNWGWVSANSSAGNVTFTSAYATNAYVVTATSNSTVATYQAAVIGTNNTVALIRTGNAASTNVFWSAIGF